jgi:asparagine synthase (glutamine-hydrolysing)
MSVQFGKWSFDGKPSDPDYLRKVSGILARYGPDTAASYSQDGLDILYHGFHTTRESRFETQPYLTPGGNVTTWNGRLDNRADFLGKFSGTLSSNFPDVSIVATAYERQGLDCFADLIGDWAVSIWNPAHHVVILSKDPIGVRHLYYSLDQDQLTWCSILDPLVLHGRNKFELDEKYIAGWFSAFPDPRLTPYVGIHSVPPSSYVVVRPGKCTTKKYWDFNPVKKIRYPSDSEYEEHFRFVFTESVQRRLRSDSPVLAELSGGMDSSSIVCVADRIIMQGRSETPRLDTLSYYDDSEPNWNERPYFSKVEEGRGCAGCHIDVSSWSIFNANPEDHLFMATPSSSGHSGQAMAQFVQCVTSQSNRVLLSGIGGDEVTGGVPTPTPQLADLLVSARLGSLARQLKAWALNKRKPWFELLLEVVYRFLPQRLGAVSNNRSPAPWLCTAFAERYQDILRGTSPRLRPFGPLPSFQDNVTTLEALRRQLACSTLQTEPLHEKRYPYLDRDFLEFIYAIPPEQLVRPGQRRSLMRRALAGIVPDEILNRKRKAFLMRGPALALSRQWDSLTDLSGGVISSDLGIVDREAYCEALRKARNGQDMPVVLLIRTIAVEMWLRNLRHWNLLRTVHEEARGSGTVFAEREH